MTDTGIPRYASASYSRLPPSLALIAAPSIVNRPFAGRAYRALVTDGASYRLQA